MSIRKHVLPLVLGLLLILAAGLALMIFAPDDVSDDAVATLTATALGILGTHIGHVSGHKLATDQEDGRG
jgi:hypothetical protein